jgi:hypothetical protein
MTLTPSQRAALRAKKAIANGNTNFKPRGENNKAEFEALKKQAQTTETTTTTTNIVSAESPPQKRMKITGGSSHTSDLASLLDIHPNTTSDTLDEEEDDAPSSPDIDSKHVEVETQPTGEGVVPKTEPCIAGKRSGNKEDAARIADEKCKNHKVKIKKREEQMKKELSKPPSIPWGVPLKPKTKALMDGTIDEFATPTPNFMLCLPNPGKRIQYFHLKIRNMTKIRKTIRIPCVSPHLAL